MNMKQCSDTTWIALHLPVAVYQVMIGIRENGSRRDEMKEQACRSGEWLKITSADYIAGEFSRNGRCKMSLSTNPTEERQNRERQFHIN